MDATAISLCMDNKLPIVVFNLNEPGNIRRVVMGEAVGTTVTARYSAAAAGLRPAMERSWMSTI